MSIKHRLRAQNEILRAENVSLRARVDKLEQENCDLAVNAEVRAMAHYEDAIARHMAAEEDLKRRDDGRARDLAELKTRVEKLQDDVERDADKGDWWIRGDAPPWEGR